MGFPNAEAYRKAASDIINSAGTDGVLSKYKSDGSGDMCFYVEATKEFVVLSNDGYIGSLNRPAERQTAFRSFFAEMRPDAYGFSLFPRHKG